MTASFLRRPAVIRCVVLLACLVIALFFAAYTTSVAWADEPDASAPSPAAASSEESAGVTSDQEQDVSANDAAGAAAEGAADGEGAAPDSANAGSTIAFFATSSETVVTTVDGLLAAIEAAPTDGAQVTIALQGNADGVFDLGTHGKIAISGQRNIVIKDAGAPVSLVRTNSGDGAAPLFYIEEGSTLTISSGAADDGAPLFSYSGQEAPRARTYQGSTLVIEGGLLAGNRSSYGTLVQNGYEDSKTDWSWGGALTITGGVFSNNASTGRYGGGVVFSNTDDAGSLTISGGTFTGNYTEATGHNDAMEAGRNHGGGAVYVRRGVLTITGGVFEANEARGLTGPSTNFGGGGGAIYVANVAALPGMTKGESHFTLSGDATFMGNKNTSSGGAIMLSWNVQGSFKSGTFENNYAQDLGGAVYTEEASVSEFGRTAVFGNTAGHFGGGLWLCPSGQGVSSPSQSNLALFDNKAGDLSLDPDSAVHGTGAAGDDFALMYPSKKEVESSSVVLGDGWYSEAGVVTWYRDGQPLPKATGFGAMNTGWSMGKVEASEAFLTDPSVARYAEGDRTQVAAGRYVLEKHHGDAWKSDAGGLALKSVVSDEAKGRAKAAASLTFTGNSAGLSGGAIGSDGSLKFVAGGVASWTKVDADDPDTVVGGSSWLLSYDAAQGEPYSDAAEDDRLWGGPSPDRWALADGTWSAVVEDNTGQDGYVGYDLDARPGHFLVANLSAGSYEMTEKAAPDGYLASDETYSFAVAADTSALFPAITGAAADNAIGNTRKPSSAQASLAANKTLVGGELTEGAFDFVLEERGDDGAYQEVQTVANKTDGAISFDPVSYDEEGTHLYRLAERAGDAANITYDQAVYYAQVVVTKGTDEAGRAALTASVAYFADEEGTQPIDAVEFVNTVSDQPPADSDQPPADEGDQPEASPHTGDNVLLQVCLALFALSATTVVVAARRMRV